MQQKRSCHKQSWNIIFKSYNCKILY